MCLALDLLSGFISANNLHSLQSMVTQRQENLATVLNMRLHDINWEVRESLLTVLTVMIKQCQKGVSICFVYGSKSRHLIHTAADV